MLTIQADISGALQSLDAIRVDQIPFATALALTRTAQIAQGAVRESLPERFKDRGNLAWLARGVRIEKATKSNLLAKVIDIDWYMAVQEEGGEKESSGQLQRVPGASMADAALKPKLADVLSQPGTFMATNAEGQEFIARRQGPDQYPITLLFFLRDRVDVKPRFGMEQTVERAVDDNFSAEFAAAMERAVATAR